MVENEFMPIISVDEDEEPHNGADTPGASRFNFKEYFLFPGIVIRSRRSGEVYEGCS
jgi:hypothetical protein